MKTTRQKEYHKERVADVFKTTLISLGVICAIVGLGALAAKSCKKCEEEQRIADSIFRADSIREADSLAAVQAAIQQTVRKDTVVYNPKVCYVNGEENISKVKHI